MQSSNDLGKLVLRVVLGVLILFHGIAKLIHGPAYIEQVLDNAGLPTIFAYAVYVGEVLAPVLLIIGLWARLGALIVIANMLVAIALVHMGEIMTLNATGGWMLELQGMFLGSAIVIALIGAGRYSIGGVAGRWN